LPCPGHQQQPILLQHVWSPDVGHVKRSPTSLPAAMMVVVVCIRVGLDRMPHGLTKLGARRQRRAAMPSTAQKPPRQSTDLPLLVTWGLLEQRRRVGTLGQPRLHGSEATPPLPMSLEVLGGEESLRNDEGSLQKDSVGRDQAPIAIMWWKMIGCRRAMGRPAVIEMRCRMTCTKWTSLLATGMALMTELHLPTIDRPSHCFGHLLPLSFPDILTKHLLSVPST